MKLLCAGPANRFLLCAALSKQTRRLGPLMPEKRIAELITIALRKCADHEFEIRVVGNTPDVIREEAARMFPPTSKRRATVATNPEAHERSRTADAIPGTSGQEPTEGVSACGASPMGEVATGGDVSVGSRIDSPHRCGNLDSFQGECSMRDGLDRAHQLQLRAFAENLCTLANRHRENHNYVVAYALYGRAAEAAEKIETPKKTEGTEEHKENGSAFVARIRKEQQAVFELLRSGKNGSANSPLDKAQKVGQ